jgi:hypothetical protein
MIPSVGFPLDGEDLLFQHGASELASQSLPDTIAFLFFRYDEPNREQPTFFVDTRK